MTIKERHYGRLAVLSLTGPFRMDPSGRGAMPLRAAVASILRRGVRQVILDIRLVPTLDAAGLGEIVLAFTTVRRKGGELGLLGPTPRVAKLLSVSRVGTVIPVHLTLDNVPDRPSFAAA